MSLPIEWPHPTPWEADGAKPPAPTPGPPGPAGPEGPEGPQGQTGAGVPAGGTTGDLLVKSSDADHHTEWAAPASVTFR
jgi:hypothetical protein